MNIFVGNMVAITQQALWGRTLDFAAQNGRISYSRIIRDGLQKDGISAFFTGPKWFSRVLMNAPAQGVLPWFYNEILPLGESKLLQGVKLFLYEPILKEYHQVQNSQPVRRLTRRQGMTEVQLAKSPASR
jgi:hypothetical protein